MPQLLKISIITVCRNAEASIEKTIRSVLSQIYTNIEFIIVDGGSTDGTLSIIDRYRKNIATIISEKDNGIYDAMNKGLHAATGDIIHFLNADDSLVNTDILTLIAEAFSDPTVEIVYGDVLLTNSQDFQSYRYLDPFIGQLDDLLAFLRRGMCHQRLFTRKSVFDKVGGFNLDYPIIADIDWFSRAWKANCRKMYIPQNIVFYNHRGKSNQIPIVSLFFTKFSVFLHTFGLLAAIYYLLYGLFRFMITLIKFIFFKLKPAS